MSSIKVKVIKGTTWIFFGRGILQGLLFIKLIFLSRFLSPQDFGVMGIALVTLSATESLSSTGLEVSLIQKKGIIENYINTVWTISIFRGMFLTSILFLYSPIIANFFLVPESEAVLKAISLVFLIRGLVNSNIIYFIKAIEAKKLFYLNLGEVLVDVFVSILGVYLYKSVWGMVYGFLAGAFSRTVLSFFVHSHVPKFHFDFSQFKELNYFGKWVWGSNVAVFISNKLDSILVGRILGVSMLGYYQMSNKVTEPIGKEIGAVISQVIYPTYSSIQGESKRLLNAYLKTLKAIFALFFPICIIFVLYASRIVPLVFGEKWISIVPVVQVLAISGLVKSMVATDGWIYYATGKPKFNFLITSCRLFFLIIFILPLTIKYGIIGTSYTVLFSNAILLVPVFFLTPRILKIGIMTYIKNLASPFFASLIIMGVYFFLYISLGQWFLWVALSLSGVSYTLIMLYIEKGAVVYALKNLF